MSKRLRMAPIFFFLLLDEEPEAFLRESAASSAVVSSSPCTSDAARTRSDSCDAALVAAVAAADSVESDRIRAEVMSSRGVELGVGSSLSSGSEVGGGPTWCVWSDALEVDQLSDDGESLAESESSTDDEALAACARRLITGRLLIKRGERMALLPLLPPPAPEPVER